MLWCAMPAVDTSNTSAPPTRVHTRHTPRQTATGPRLLSSCGGAYSTRKSASLVSPSERPRPLCAPHVESPRCGHERASSLASTSLQPLAKHLRHFGLLTHDCRHTGTRENHVTEGSDGRHRCNTHSRHSRHSSPESQRGGSSSSCQAGWRTYVCTPTHARTQTRWCAALGATVREDRTPKLSAVGERRQARHR